MNKKTKNIVKRTRKEELEYRKLQKAIASLPKPSFNNPEKAQPKNVLPIPVKSSIQPEKATFNEDKNQKEKEIILDSAHLKIETVAQIKKPKKKHIVKKIFHYLKSHIWLLVFSIFFSLLSSAMSTLIPLFVGRGIDCAVGAGSVDFEGIIKYCIILIALVVVNAFSMWFSNKLSNTLSYKIEEGLHNDIFKKFNKVPLKFIDNSSHGDLQSRMINDVDDITDGFVIGLTTLANSITTIILTLIFMYMLNPIIATIVVCLTPLSVVTSYFITRKSNKYFKQQAKAVGDISGNIIEMLGNQKVIQAFQYEDNSIEKFDNINKRLSKVNEKALFFSSCVGPTSRFVNGLIYAVVAIVGTIVAIKNGLSVGIISTLLSYANRYSRPFNNIADVFSDIQAAVVGAMRVFNVLDIENEISDEGLAQIKRNKGTVELKNVDFSYSPNKKLIQNLNLSVSKGQKIAIVGPTGCGKSTLINLLMRFYDIDKGEILISGHSIDKVTRKSLRSQFGMVLQETWLFSASIRDNIKYGKQDATDAEVKKAARMAGADYFIETLPNGYDTIINESGDNLSQGQKQLICIARIMLTHPPMLILDEATSNIDTRTELQIQEAFNKIMVGRTSFIVAHRLSTITSADTILVMNKGNIIEQGSHKELLAKKGFYYNLYDSQFSNY